MAYTGYWHFTRKQCNVLYRAFMEGALTPPKDARGKVKKPSFVYGYEGASYWQGMSLSDDERRFNCQLSALEDCLRHVFAGELERAQGALDGDHCPEGIDKRTMWKRA